jgi:uncharacterized protein (TIGR04255 family)
MIMSLPKRISPCPLIDSVVELRFQPNVHPDATFGLIYSALNKDFGEVKKLPILEIPTPIRDSDPNLKHSPHYQLRGSSHSFIVQSGPRVISISKLGEYPGWSDFSLKIKMVLEKFQETGICKTFTRVGIRSIDFFEDNIYQHINLTIKIDNTELQSKQSTIVAQLIDEGIETRMQVSNGARVVDVNKKQRIGSIIDLDTFMENPVDFDSVYQIIDKCHLVQKGRFFGLLKPEFLLTLHPEY